MRSRALIPAFEPVHQAPALVGNDYEVTGVLGRGAGAVVYRAFSRSRNEDVALKMPDPSFEGSGRSNAAVRQEALQLQALQHPSIVPVLAIGYEQSVPYFVMPLAPLGSLRTLLARAAGPMPLAWTVRVVTAVADALRALHDQGLVHLDVKPGNILLTEGDWPWLSDFATVARADADWHPLGRWRLPGTPTYMAPEHKSGYRVDARSDQYSLALVTWELLTGIRPIRLFGIAPPQLPPPVAAVLGRALSEQPDGRFATVRGFASALAEAADMVAAERGGPDRTEYAATIGALPLLGLIGSVAVTAGPRPVFWDWPWTIVGFGALVLLRVLLHARIMTAIAWTADLLMAASEPGTDDPSVERRRLQRSLDAIGDMVCALIAGVFLLTMLQAFFGISVSEPRAALLTSGALIVAWSILVARLVWLGGTRGAAAALLLSIPALEMFLAPAVHAEANPAPLLVVHLVLGLQLGSVLLVAREAVRRPLARLFVRWLELTLLGDKVSISQADLRNTRREYQLTVGETLDLTLIVLTLGALLAPILRWFVPTLAWQWSLWAVLAVLTLAWVRWALRLHSLTSERRASQATLGPGSSPPL